jgi:hypothetical protein
MSQLDTSAKKRTAIPIRFFGMREQFDMFQVTRNKHVSAVMAPYSDSRYRAHCRQVPVVTNQQSHFGEIEWWSLWGLPEDTWAS